MAGNQPPPSEDAIKNIMDSLGLSREAAISLLTGGPGVSNTIVPKVWMGDHAPGAATAYSAPGLPGLGGGPQTAFTPGMTGTTKKTGFLPQEAAQAAFFQWTPAELADAKQKMIEAGFQVSTPADVQSVWKMMVEGAAQTNVAHQQGAPGARSMSPWQVLAHMAQANQTGAPTTQTSTTSLSASDVQHYADDAYQSQVGRDPTKAEAGAIPSSTTSTTTQTTDGAGNTVSHTQSGADVAQLAKEQAQAAPDYAEYQAATTYYDAMMSALGRVN